MISFLTVYLLIFIKILSSLIDFMWFFKWPGSILCHCVLHCLYDCYFIVISHITSHCHYSHTLQSNDIFNLSSKRIVTQPMAVAWSIAVSVFAFLYVCLHICMSVCLSTHMDHMLGYKFKLHEIFVHFISDSSRSLLLRWQCSRLCTLCFTKTRTLLYFQISSTNISQY